MSIIEKTFNNLKKQGRKAFIPYIMAGDPSLEKTKELIKVLEECGADIIELGVPFTDPLADGPVIQRASERALAKGVTLRDVIRLVKDIRAVTKIPIVLMTYYNPIFAYKEEAFVRDAVSSQIDGIIVPDLPPDEAHDLIRLSRKKGIDIIFMLAPTSTAERVKKVAKLSRGFIYYVSLTGITGARLLVDTALSEAIMAIRRLTEMPICVGFGVASPEEAKVLSDVADGIIVGSAIVRRLDEPEEELKRFLRGLRDATQ
ncbi:MAG: tryptophan synthase subunit alpha [Nitrospirae bacterium]|nr:tryptophan synthase subunit alpha [Nitrospirota bacterium]